MIIDFVIIDAENTILHKCIAQNGRSMFRAFLRKSVLVSSLNH